MFHEHKLWARAHILKYMFVEQFIIKRKRKTGIWKGCPLLDLSLLLLLLRRRIQIMETFFLTSSISSSRIKYSKSWFSNSFSLSSFCPPFPFNYITSYFLTFFSELLLFVFASPLLVKMWVRVEGKTTLTSLDEGKSQEINEKDLFCLI